MFQSMKEEENRIVQNKPVKTMNVRFLPDFSVSTKLSVYHQKRDNDDRNLPSPKIPSIRNGKRYRSIPVQLSLSLPTYLTYPPTYTLPVSPPCDVWSPRAGYDTHTPTHISNSSMYLHVGE